MINNTYYCLNDCLIYQGKVGRSDLHAHHYIQMGISAEPVFKLRSDNQQNYQPTTSYFIPSDQPHQLALNGDAPVLMVWLDPEHQTSHTYQNDDGIQPLSAALQTHLQPLAKEPLNCRNALQIRNAIIGHSFDKQQELDERLATAISWIKQHLTHQTITSEVLADIIHLSKSRFMHLFSDQVGIPVRKFILWQRLLHALQHLSEGDTITESAHAAGFTDSAHMNRTFKTMFGITPSAIFKNSRFIQVSAC
ncbi:MAG: helix-turn-helix domain-containing protein [Bacteroidota bacterium]